MTSPATSRETEKVSLMPWRQPEGEEEAKVALTTSRTATKVMYQRRAVDQHLGSVGWKDRLAWRVWKV